MAEHKPSDGSAPSGNPRNGTKRNGTERRTGRPAIQQHPLFPAIVALWCGALGGLASLGLGPLIEHLAAATPLGGLARVLVPVAMAVLGALIGLALARRIAGPGPVLQAQRRERTESIEESPEITTPALAEEPVAPEPPVLRRRRALTARDDVEPQSTPEAEKPDPIEPRILDVSELDLESFDAAPLAPEHADVDADLRADLRMSTPVEAEAQADLPAVIRSAASEGGSASFAGRLLEAYANPSAARLAEPVAEPGFALLSGDATEPARPAQEPVFVPADHHPQAEAPAPMRSAPVPEADRRSAAERIAAAELDDLSPMELLERLALAMERRREIARGVAAPVTAPVATPEPRPASVPSVEAATEPAPAPVPAAPVAAAESEPTPIATLPEITPHDTPSPQAPEPDAPAMIAEPVEAPTVEAPTVEATVETPAIEASATVSPFAPFARPFAVASVPAALRPVAFDAGDEEDEALPGYVPPRHIGALVASEDQAGDHASIRDAAPAGSLAPFEPRAYEAPFAMSKQQDDLDGDGDSDEDAVEDDGEVLEQGYSSLLNLSRPAAPRQPFFQAEDVPAEDEHVKDAQAQEESATVVDPRSSRTAPFAPPAPTATGAVAGPKARLFDAPGREPSQDTERALRAALATLQRMSGAA